MIFNITENDNNSLIKVDDEEGSISNSPVFNDMNENWSHLIKSFLSNDSIDNNFLTTADTENGGKFPVSTNSEAAVANNLTADAMSHCAVPANAKETRSDSTANAADSWALSADIFANSGSVTEPNDSGSKNSPVANEQNGITGKSVQPQTDDEVMEIGKSLSQTLNIVSSDNTSGSSPDIEMPQKMSSASNSGKDKKKLDNTRKTGSFKFQDLTSGHREGRGQNSKELRSRNRVQGKEADSSARQTGQGKFSSAEKLRNGHKTKTANRRKSESKSNSPHNRNHRFRKQTGNARVNARPNSVNLST
jgi:hypothetical protein